MKTHFTAIGSGETADFKTILHVGHPNVTVGKTRFSLHDLTWAVRYGKRTFKTEQNYWNQMFLMLSQELI